MTVQHVLVAVASYLAGSISAGVLISRSVYHDDVRTHGSGSAGMTNMLRSYSGSAAAFTFLFDFVKAAVPTALALRFVDRQGAEIAAFFVLLGHVAPIFFGFRGGKGMVPAAGSIFVLYPLLAFCLFIPWAVLVCVTRTVSVGSIAAIALYPVGILIYCRCTGLPPLRPFLLAAVSAALVLYMHRGNLRRLRRGTEHKFERKKPM